MNEDLQKIEELSQEIKRLTNNVSLISKLMKMQYEIIFAEEIDKEEMLETIEEMLEVIA